MKQIQCLILVLLFFRGMTLSAQTPEWEWARSIGSFYSEWICNIASDSDGNIYIAGHMEIPDSIFPNYFIAKYSDSGNMIWVQSIDYADYHNYCFIQKNNYLFLSGNYNGDTLIFNNDTIIGQHIYISKYNLEGDLIWKKTAGTYNLSEGYVGISEITADNAGNLYILGFFSETAELTVGSIVLSPNTTQSFFVAKYDSNGNSLWAKTVGGYGTGSITTDSNCNIYITGYFEGTTTKFDSITLLNTNSGYSDIFIAKYDSTGNIIWAKSAGGTSWDICNDIASDDAGNIYITGYFESSNIIFDNDTLINLYPNYGEFFLTKYSSSGDVLWAKNSIGISRGSNISIDAFDNIYITGTFGKTDYPQVIFDSITLTNPGRVFIIKYNSSGSVIWAKQNQAGYFGNSDSYIETSLEGNIYITGTYMDNFMIFENDTLVNISGICDPFSGLLCEDIFLAKLSNSPTTINEIKPDNSILLYPNPASNKIYLDFQSSFFLSPATNFNLYDIHGRLFIKQSVYSEKTPVDISILPAGIYIGKVSNESKVLVFKLIKQ